MSKITNTKEKNGKKVKIENKYNVANAYQGIGDIFKLRGNNNKAKEYYFKSLNKFVNIGDKFQISEMYYTIGNYYFDIGEKNSSQLNFDKALDNYNKALDIAQKIGNPLTQKKVLQKLSELHKKIGNMELSENYKKKYEEFEKALMKTRMLKLAKLYGFEIKMERANSRGKYLSVAFGIASLLTFVIMLLYVKQWKSNKLLTQQKCDIEKLSEIGKDIITSIRPKEIVERVYENVNQLMDANVFSIDIHNEKLNRLEADGAKEEGIELPLCYYDLEEEDCLTVKCFKTGKLIKFDDYQKEYLNYISNIQRPKAGKHFKSHIFLPLVLTEKGGKEGKKMGVITVQSSKKNAYSDYHLNMLKNIANYAAIALENALIIREKDEALEREIAINTHIDSYIHTISHEYKTPLSIISNCVENLKDYSEKMTKSEIGDHFERIFSNIDYVQDLIDDLLSFGEVSKFVECDLNKLTREVIDKMSHTIGKNRRIEYTDFEQKILLMLCEKLITRVITELLVNAINYSDDDSTILVELRKEQCQVVLSVKDEGRGILPGDLKLVFDRFHRGGNVKDVKGTGLGLALVKRYIDLHKGQIEIRSQVGKGTTVEIRMPLLLIENRV